VIPRTTAAGLFAAILGLERDSYYQKFGEQTSVMAIVPQTSLTTMSLPRSELSTAPSAPKNLDDIGAPGDTNLGIVTINRESMQSRQRNPYEMLRKVSYRIYVSLGDQELYEKLRMLLSEGRSVYTPALGLSECLASIEFQGEVSMETTDVETIDSILPDDRSRVQPTPQVTYVRERVPQFMERVDDGGRRTTDFVTYTLRRDGGPIDVSDEIPVAEATDSNLDDRVVFH
jgi:CRISPR-associated protein Cas5h